VSEDGVLDAESENGEREEDAADGDGGICGGLGH